MYKDIGRISWATVNQLKKIVDNVERWEVHVSDITEHHAVNCIDQVKNIKGLLNKLPVGEWKWATFMRLPPGW